MSKSERYICSWILFFQHMVDLNIKANSAKEVQGKLLTMLLMYARGTISVNQRREMQGQLDKAVEKVKGTNVEIELFYNLIQLFLEEVSEQTRDNNKIRFIDEFLELLNQTGYIKRLGDGVAKNTELTFKQTEEIYQTIKESLKW